MSNPSVEPSGKLRSPPVAARVERLAFRGEADGHQAAQKRFSAANLQRRA